MVDDETRCGQIEERFSGNSDLSQSQSAYRGLSSELLESIRSVAVQERITFVKANILSNVR
jgi:hypothetical protein